MSFFTEQTHTIPLDDENSVTVRKISYGAQQNALSASSKINPITQDATIDFAGLRKEQLIAAIAGWTGPGFEGRPVNRENILALPVDIAAKIEEGIEAFNKPLDEAEKKP